MIPSRGFGSDNHSGVHPEIWSAMARVREGHCASYEMDPISRRAHECLKKHFGSTCHSFFVFNGTAANVLALRPLLESWQAVFCADSSHLNGDECAAPENYLGCKLLPLPAIDGKIRPEQIESHLIRRGDQHHVQPRVISITQPTEFGTLYTPEEIRALAETARRHNLLLHMDGARLVNAAAALDISLSALTAEAGVDALSLGGTKNGLLFGEAVIFFDEKWAKNFKFHRKQAMQLPSKTRFLAAQFEAWLGTDLWLRNARHANAMAARLSRALQEFPFIEVTRPTQANAVFARIPKKLVAPLRDKYFFYVWDEATFEVRLMMSFDTQDGDLDGFLQEIRRRASELGL